MERKEPYGNFKEGEQIRNFSVAAVKIRSCFLMDFWSWGTEDVLETNGEYITAEIPSLMQTLNQLEKGEILR